MEYEQNTGEGYDLEFYRKDGCFPMKGKKHWLKAISLSLVLASLVVFLTGCGSFDATDGSQTVDAMMTVMDQVQSVETSITLDIQGRFSSGVSIDSEPHTAAVTSTATVESSFSPMACHGQYYSSIQVDGAVTREERECYIREQGGAYHDNCKHPPEPSERRQVLCLEVHGQGRSQNQVSL